MKLIWRRSKLLGARFVPLSLASPPGCMRPCINPCEPTFPFLSSIVIAFGMTILLRVCNYTISEYGISAACVMIAIERDVRAFSG